MARLKSFNRATLSGSLLQGKVCLVQQTPSASHLMIPRQNASTKHSLVEQLKKGQQVSL